MDIIHSMCTYFFGQFRPQRLETTKQLLFSERCHDEVAHLRRDLVRRSFGSSKTIKFLCFWYRQTGGLGFLFGGFVVLVCLQFFLFLLVGCLVVLCFWFVPPTHERWTAEPSGSTAFEKKIERELVPQGKGTTDWVCFLTNL